MSIGVTAGIMAAIVVVAMGTVWVLGGIVGGNRERRHGK